MPRCCTLLGIDHKRLTVKFQGLDARLTGIAGNVYFDIIQIGIDLVKVAFG
jgi:hypothetical protein